MMNITFDIPTLFADGTDFQPWDHEVVLLTLATY